MQVFHEGLGKDGFRPLFINIFDPQDQGPAGLAHLQPGQESRPDIAQMDIAVGLGAKRPRMTLTS